MGVSLKSNCFSKIDYGCNQSVTPVRNSFCRRARVRMISLLVFVLILLAKIRENVRIYDKIRSKGKITKKLRENKDI